ncbi:DUF2867 domain-containing protein [Desulfococcus sp.]|uniref:DUF2867 domain-containing protein n=1 Tax=Desulfococcus sp. TaxID=2025834 RepID=UPI00359351F4
MISEKPVLVIGSTGYVGGRLVPLLLESGYRVRAMGRSLSKLASRSWAQHPLFEMVQGDIQDLESMQNASRGCRAAFYLVHSMVAAGRDFARADRQGAHNMAAAAAHGGMDRIIYLGGLAEAKHHRLSEHLQSRKEVAEILNSGSVPCTDLRAGAILGAGSASFEILRYTVERLPVMLAPKWVQTLNQPIAIRNVLLYLKGCLETDAVLGETFDIGGPDVLSYRRLAEIYAEEAGLPRRRIIPVPFVSPGFSAFLIHQVTPVPAALARPLIEGLRNESVCGDDRIHAVIPQHCYTCREAIRMAMESVRAEKVETCWSDAGCLIPPEWTYCGDADYTGGTILECGYRIGVAADAEAVWEAVERIGGDTGWYFGDLLWQLRGAVDGWAGGVGLRRGRRHPTHLRVGDALDFWRILELDPGRRLLLSAEMKLPGEALFEIRITPRDGETEIDFLSRFVPKGLGGLMYWYALYPAHQWVFEGMLKGLARAVGKPVTSGPRRFTPAIPDTCPPPWRMN